MDTLRPLGVLSASILYVAQVFACGACVEDKVAVTYDFEVAQRARAQHKTVVYCEMLHTVPHDTLAKAAARVRGIDAQTLRTATAPAAASFVVDTSQQTPEAAVEQLQQQAGAPNSLSIIRVVMP